MKKKRYKRYKRKKTGRRLVFLGIVIVMALFILNSCFPNNHRKSSTTEEITLSTAVKTKASLLEDYATKYGIEAYTDYLLAIMQVESAGLHPDVMQSSESLGLPPNSLDTEESIDQGCRYFAKILRLSNNQDCDFNTAIQAYNFGDDFVAYVAENGGVYSFDLAQSYAAQKSNEEKTTYLNPVAIKENGGWRYQYGNMFYVQLVLQYI